VVILGFGNWDEKTHLIPEQQKRLFVAMKADVTPSEVDTASQTAVFKGSGKKLYVTTLNSCTCGDFLCRRLPCKHIYRLALELGMIEGDYDSGRNKNALSDDVSCLKEEAQKLLYDMCVASIYHQEKQFLFRRDKISESLLTHGFCVESIPDLDYFAQCPVSQIKSILFSGISSNLPKRNAQKKTFIKWISENAGYSLEVLRSNFIVLEFSSQTKDFQSTIHRRLAKKFGCSDSKCDDFVIEIRANLTK
jgi:predicted nucleic acid-binding Zn finger protein